MPSFLAVLPFTILLIVLSAGFTAAHIDSLRRHRAGTADRALVSFVWRQA